MCPQKLSIFISHPSDFLTNCQLHGDGLVAFEFINRLAKLGHILHVTIPSMDIQAELPNEVKLYPVRALTPFSTLKPLEYMVEVRQIFNYVYKNYRVDLIHQLNPVSPGRSFSLIGTEVPIILGLFVPGWPADAEPEKFKTFSLGTIILAVTQPLIRACDRQQQKKAAALLLSTPAAVNRLYEPEIDKGKIHYLPYGIDTTCFSPAKSQHTQASGELSILYLASLSHRKGIFTLLDAFEKVVDALPSCKLTIAGSGSELKQVQQRISTMSCRGQISLLGRVERDRVPEVIRQCTVYCLPSYQEPFGISALEAMACSKPVVATDAGGLAYLISEQGGCKVPPRDAQALAEALIEILASPELQMTMGQYNRNLVEATYSWERVIEKLESIYYRVKEAHQRR